MNKEDKKEVHKILEEIGVKIVGFRYYIDREGQVQQIPIVEKISCEADMRSVDKGLQERAVSDLHTAIEDTYKKLRGTE